MTYFGYVYFSVASIVLAESGFVASSGIRVWVLLSKMFHTFLDLMKIELAMPFESSNNMEKWSKIAYLFCIRSCTRSSSQNTWW
jgi:hypothetical protein